MKILREATSQSCFDLKKSNSSYYTDLLNGDRPCYKGANYSYNDYMKFEKGIDHKIVYMTCDEYFDQVDRYVFKNPYQGVNSSKVDEYAEAMKQGSVFPTPYLNFTEDSTGQEGRHRMLAMAQAFGDDARAPVQVVTDANPSDEEIYEYAKKKTPNDPQWTVNYVTPKFRKVKSSDESERYEEIEAIDCSAGMIIDAGDGKVKVDYTEVGRTTTTLYCSGLDNSDSNPIYELDDYDAVKYYGRKR